MSKGDEKARGVVHDTLAFAYGQLVASEPQVLEGGNADAVHRMRTATRRLRSNLATFAPLVDHAWATNLAADLRWLAGELGAVRDVDVMQDRLLQHSAELTDGEATAIARVVNRLDSDRAAAHAMLVASLRSPQYTALLAQLQRADTTKRDASRRKRDAVALHALRRRWDKLERAVDRLGPQPTDAGLHDVRMRAKRCRYAAEACAPAFGKHARALGNACAAIQDILGSHHDAVVAGAWLTKAAPECSPEEAFALGRLVEIEHCSAARATREFRDVWKRARKTEPSRW